MTKPVVKLSGTESSAFTLLVRARRAMHDAGWPRSKIERFSADAGETDVMRFGEGWTPPAVYERVLREVRKVCVVKMLKLN